METFCILTAVVNTRTFTCNVNCTELNLFTNEYRQNQGSLNPISFNIHILVVTGYQVQAVQHVTTGSVRVPCSLQLRLNLQLSQNKESDFLKVPERLNQTWHSLNAAHDPVCSPTYGAWDSGSPHRLPTLREADLMHFHSKQGNLARWSCCKTLLVQLWKPFWG